MNIYSGVKSAAFSCSEPLKCIFVFVSIVSRLDESAVLVAAAGYDQPQPIVLRCHASYPGSQTIPDLSGINARIVALEGYIGHPPKPPKPPNRSTLFLETLTRQLWRNNTIFAIINAFFIFCEVFRNFRQL